MGTTVEPNNFKINNKKMLDLDILWWGRSDINYSRNRVIRKCLVRLGCSLTDFSPLSSPFALLEARLRNLKKPTLVWVPCFRQRDMKSASKWSKKQQVPLVFDPLISAYDKQVLERGKFSAESKQGIKLLNWEKQLFQSADLIIGDTPEHCSFFNTTFGVPTSKLIDIPVGAEESVFHPPLADKPPNSPLTVLFYGSFLTLQGPEVIIEAARLYQGDDVQWKMIGNGPLLDDCKKNAAGINNVEFIPWVSYDELPSHIQSADILLGIFGTSEKAHRVIPNKVYQSLACGKPLVTMRSPAYPENFMKDPNLGIFWTKSGDPKELAHAVAELSKQPDELHKIGTQAQQTFTRYFSEADIERRLLQTLKQFKVPESHTS